MFQNSKVTLHIVNFQNGAMDKVSFTGKLYLNFSDTWVFLSWEDGSSETFKATAIDRISVEVIDDKSS